MSIPQYAPEELQIPKHSTHLSIGELVSGKGRLICIGDVHGCLAELLQLLELVAPKPEDVLVFLGDYVDRGPRSGAVVEFIRELCATRPGTYAVMGNHDEKHARARRHLAIKHSRPDYVIPMKKFFGDTQRAAEHAEITDAGCHWIAGLPTVVALERRKAGDVRIMTHAGLIQPSGLKGWKYAARQDTKALIRNRYVKLRSQTQEVFNEADEWIHVQADRGPRGEYVQPPGSKIWDEVWEGPRVITGHIVHDLKDVRVMNDCYGVDTGCCFGGHLTAYVEDLATSAVSIVQVPAMAEYAKHGEPES